MLVAAPEGVVEAFKNALWRTESSTLPPLVIAAASVVKFWGLSMLPIASREGDVPLKRSPTLGP